MPNKPELPIKEFASSKDWEEWLAKNLQSSSGVWLKIAKKASGITTVTYAEGLDVALCYGWIDGQRRSFNEKYFIQKFTPRRPRSLWSKRNVGKVAELIAAGKMTPEGFAEIEAAKLDGRWDAAYDSQKDMVIPEDFIEAVESSTSAKENFAKLNKASLFHIGWRLQTAKTPTVRARRFQVLLEKLEKGEEL